jgi:hypothetical protein
MMELQGFTNPRHVHKRRPVRYLVVPVALLALLMLVMVLGSVSHHHAGPGDANCSICHLSHQPIDHPQPSHREPSLAQVGVQIEIQEPGFAPSPVFPRLPARAPPTV